MYSVISGLHISTDTEPSRKEVVLGTSMNFLSKCNAVIMECAVVNTLSVVVILLKVERFH